MNGLSGAIVTDNGDNTVTKRGGDASKTRAQGAWLQQHASAALPCVIELLDDGYTMEKLDELEPLLVRAHDVTDMLRHEIWSRPPLTMPSVKSWTALKLKVVANITADAVREKLRDSDVRIMNATHDAVQSAYDVPSALAHGDPTAENVMLRRSSGKPVLIDPIESTEAVPDSPCVDIGKMFQSAYGWETAKYGVDMPTYSVKDIVSAVDDEKLVAGGRAWAVVHVVRALPYVGRNAPESLDRALGLLELALRQGGY